MSVGLPPNWTVVHDAQNRTFFFNTVTKQSSWTAPQLPANWQYVKDPGSGKCFYYNSVTKQSSWTWPDTPASTPAPASSTPASTVTTTTTTASSGTGLESPRSVASVSPGIASRFPVSPTNQGGSSSGSSSSNSSSSTSSTAGGHKGGGIAEKIAALAKSQEETAAKRAEEEKEKASHHASPSVDHKERTAALAAALARPRALSSDTPASTTTTTNPGSNPLASPTNRDRVGSADAKNPTVRSPTPTQMNRSASPVPTGGVASPASPRAVTSTTTTPTTAQQTNPATAGLPPGWSRVTDSASGRTYYWNSIQKTSTWTAPPGTVQPTPTPTPPAQPTPPTSTSSSASSSSASSSSASPSSASSSSPSPALSSASPAASPARQEGMSAAMDTNEAPQVWRQKKKIKATYTTQKFGKVEKKSKWNKFITRWLSVKEKGRIEVFASQTRDKKAKPINIEKAVVTPMDKNPNEALISVKEVDRTVPHILIAENFRERESWLDAFEDHGAFVHRPIIQGWLYKASSGNPRFCILYADIFVYYRKQADEKHAGEVQLPMGAECNIEQKDEGGFKVFTLSSSGDQGSESLSFFAKDKTVENIWLNTMYKLMRLKLIKMKKESLLEGYLWKCNSNMTKWAKRYFILLNDALLYYKKKSDDKPTGHIPLPGGFEVEKVGDPKGKREHMFAVAENWDDNTRMYHMQAANEAERDFWMTSLLKLSMKKDSKRETSSVFEAYIWKQGGKLKDKWQKRYCILYRDRLRYYKSKNDVRVTGEIILSFASAMEETPTGFNLGSTARSKIYTFKPRHQADQINWVAFVKWVIGKCKGEPPAVVYPKSVEVREVAIDTTGGEASSDVPSFIPKGKGGEPGSPTPSQPSQPTTTASPQHEAPVPSPFAMAHHQDTKSKHQQYPSSLASPARSPQENNFVTPEKTRSASPEPTPTSSISSSSASSSSSQSPRPASPSTSSSETNPTWVKFLQKLKKKKNRTFEEIRHVDKDMFVEMTKSLGFKDIWEQADLIRIFQELTKAS